MKNQVYKERTLIKINVQIKFYLLCLVLVFNLKITSQIIIILLISKYSFLWVEFFCKLIQTRLYLQFLLAMQGEMPDEKAKSEKITFGSCISINLAEFSSCYIQSDGFLSSKLALKDFNSAVGSRN